MADDDAHENSVKKAIINVDLSKGIEKLVEAVSQHFDAERLPKRIVKVAEARAKALLIEADSERALQERAESWESARAANRQMNREQIINAAAESIRQLPPGIISDERVDPDWTSRFFTACEDVSDEQIQSLWSQILAGEVATPGRFSIRTLDTVRTLPRRDAEMFQWLCGMTWSDQHGNGLVFVVGDYRRFLEPRGLIPFTLDRLKHVGLLGERDRNLIFETANPQRYTYHGNTYDVHGKPANLREGPAIVPLTIEGSELFRICAAAPDRNYEKAVIETLRTDGFAVAEVKD